MDYSPSGALFVSAPLHRPNTTIASDRTPIGRRTTILKCIATIFLPLFLQKNRRAKLDELNELGGESAGKDTGISGGMYREKGGRLPAERREDELRIEISSILLCVCLA